jgi:hypothetical protein
MRFWQIFWTLNIIVAGGSFAIITVIVGIRGVKDLREMLRGLSSKHGDE